MLKVSQAEYVNKVMKRFNMTDIKLVSIPLIGHFKLSETHSDDKDKKALIFEVSYTSVVASLMYAMVCMRSDIAQAVGVISRYMSSTRKEYWRALKWILRFLKGNLDMTLCYRGTEVQLLRYVISNFVVDVDSQRSITSYIFTLGSGAVS